MRRFAFHILLAVTILSSLPVAGRPLSDCTHAARLEVAGYAGTETLAGVPVLVRLSESIPGFHYADCGAEGAGLVFCDEANEVVFPHEIDEWNPDGESLVWVRLSSLAAGTAFQMGWGGTAAAPDPHAVWSDYAGVWHMNEASGIAFDSTTNGLDGVPSTGTNTLADVSQMVAFENGACGRARVNCSAELTSGNFMTIPSYDGLGLGSMFVFSGWYRANHIEDYPSLAMRQPNAFDANGWGLEVCTYYPEYAESGDRVNVVGGARTSDQQSPYLSTQQLPRSLVGEWSHLVLCYNGTSVRVYDNGTLLTNAQIVAASDNGLPLVLGNKTDGSANSFNGQYDEIRLRGGTLSADRIRADYDMIADLNFLAFGTVIDMPDAPTVLAEGDLVPGVSIRLGGAPNGWTLHYTTDGSTPTADSPVYEEPFALAESATVKVVAVNDDLGWTTGVAEQRFDLAPPLAVTDAQARQRYPWNGLVDVDFTLAGDTAKCYRVSIDVADLDGGTNLTAQTVWEDRAMYDAPPNHGTLTNAVLDVAPGAHRFVWNAGVDLPEGFVADRLAVSLRAEYLHDTALYMVVDLSGGPNAAHYPVSYLPDVPEGGWTDEYKTEKLVLRRIEPGWFTMGRRATDYPNAESTARSVRLSQPEYVSVFETTQAQWFRATGMNPAENLGETRPVERVSYNMIRGSALGSEWPLSSSVDNNSIIGILRSKTMGQFFDLPTSAQWEYACRAGTDTALNSGKNLTTTHDICSNANEVARYSGNSGWRYYNYNTGVIETGNWDGLGGFDKTAIVGSYPSNAWGIFDTHGNVWEWCLDWFSDTQNQQAENPCGPATGSTRVVRGGAWNSPAIGASAGEAGQNYAPERNEQGTFGFRLFLHDAPAVVEAPIVAPEGLAATTNRTGDVTLSWEPVTGAYAYQIRRSKTGAFEDGTWLNTVTNTTYADWTAAARTDYAYWVRAQFESGKVGRWSEGKAGCRHKGYTVHFDANGGTGEMADLELRFDEPQALTGCGFSKSGNVFAGWATTAGGSSVYADGETVENLSLEPGAIVTLYACWATSSYTVKFSKNASAATGTMADQTMTRNANAALRANSFVRAGYKFAGWATSASGAKVYDDKQSVKNLTTGSSITLYAVWEALTAQNALYMVIDLSGGANASSYPVSYLSAIPSGGWTDTYKTTKLVLRRIEPGSFMMCGQYQTTLTKPFYIGVFEVTQKQYQLVTGKNPSSPDEKGDAIPVEYLSYEEIRGASNGAQWPTSSAVDSGTVLGKIRGRTGLAFDLPTEAQWEYACRAGTTSNYNNGGNTEADLKKVGRYKGNSVYYHDGYTGYRPSKAGSYKPNNWGLYDMHGNVEEWCLDRKGDLTGPVIDPTGPLSGLRIVRGGSHHADAVYCTSSSRNAQGPSYKNFDLGFRLAIVINE